MPDRAVTDWLKEDRLVCPECGYLFGERTVAGSIAIHLPPELPAECKHCGEVVGEGYPCPRVREAIAEAERSDRTK